MQPKQFWTGTLKVVMVLFIICGAISSLISAIAYRVWWIAPVGWIMTFFSAAGIGTLIEISENIAARLELESLNESNFTASGDDPYTMFRSDSNQQSAEKTSDDSYSILGYSSQSVSSEAAKKPITYEKKDYWICPACGEFNNLDTVICKRCDQQAWICPKCGEGNDFDSTACAKCGWQA